MVCSVSEMMNKVAEQNHTGVCFPFCCRGWRGSWREEKGASMVEDVEEMWAHPLSGVCVRERGVEGISLLFVHEKETRYDC